MKWTTRSLPKSRILITMSHSIKPHPQRKVYYHQFHFPEKETKAPEINVTRPENHTSGQGHFSQDQFQSVTSSVEVMSSLAQVCQFQAPCPPNLPMTALLNKD